MKCEKCNKTWILSKSIGYSTKCPFCGFESKNLTFNIGSIVIEYGTEIFKQKKKLNALIKDLYIDPVFQKRLITAINSGISEYYYEAINNDGIQRQSQLKNASKLLKNTLGIEDSIAESIINEFNTSITINDESQYEIMLDEGKRQFYGLGCEINIVKAIKAFELCLNYEINLDDDFYSTNSIHKALPFLIESYYEDVLINNNKHSLQKLKKYADNYNFKMAQRYLRRFYEDHDNPYRSEKDAKKYDELYDAYIFREEETDIDYNELFEDMIEQISDGYNDETFSSFENSIVWIGDHLILENDYRYSNLYNYPPDICENILAQYYYYAALVLYEYKKTDYICRIRIRNYLDNYIELVGGDGNEEYCNVIILWLKSLIIDYPNIGIHKLEDAEYYIDSLNEFNFEIDKNIKKVIYMAIFIYHVNNNNENKINEYCKMILDLGHDIRCMLGIYWIQNNNIEQSYNVLFDYYKDHKDEDYEDKDLVEYIIGLYRLNHKEKYTESDALEYWKSSIMHCKENGSIMNDIGSTMRDGWLIDDDLGINLTVNIDIDMAVEAFKKGASLGNEECIKLLNEIQIT